MVIVSVPAKVHLTAVPKFEMVPFLFNPSSLHPQPVSVGELPTAFPVALTFLNSILSGLAAAVVPVLFATNSNL